MDSVSGKKFSTINPANGTVIAEVSEGDKVFFFYIYYITLYFIFINFTLYHKIFCIII